MHAERYRDRKIEAVTASMFSSDIMGRSFLRIVVLEVYLNAVTHVTIDLRSGTRPNGGTVKRRRKTRAGL